MPSSGRKRILYVSPLPPPAGGIASWTSRIVAQGVTDRYSVAVVNARVGAGRSTAERGGWNPRELIRGGRILGALARALILRRPAVVHLNCSLSPVGVFRDWLCGLLVKAFRVPLVTHYRGHVPDFVGARGRDLSTACLVGLIRLTDGNVVLNEPSREAVGTHCGPGRSTPVVIPNFIEDQVCEMPPPDRSGGPFRVLYVGSIMPAKGSREIMEAARRMPDARFDLIGDCVAGAPSAPAKQPSNVRLLGALERDRVIAEMSQSDVLILPSFTEGFPNVVLEAMAVGLPVIASRVGAIPEMLMDPEGGLLVAPGDVAGLTRALELLAADEALRRAMGRYNKERSREKYAYSIVVRQLAALYDRVIAGREAGAAA